MKRMSRWSGVAMAVVAVACGSHAMEIEDVPLGAEVAITRDDGGVVEGTLAERTAENVAINQGTETNKKMRSVPVQAITDVQLVDDAEPLVLPPTARFREVLVTAGTDISAKLSTGLNTSTSKAGDVVEAVIEEPITVDGAVVIPAGSHLHGEVKSAERSGKVQGRANLSVEFDNLTVDGHDSAYPVSLAISRVAASSKDDDAKKIGLPAAGGALIGGILGGGKGALKGLAIGAGAGTALVLTTRGKEVSLPAGTVLHMTLKAPVELKVPIERQ